MVDIDRLGPAGEGLAYYLVERKISHSFILSMLAQMFSVLSVVLPLLFVNSSEISDLDEIADGACFTRALDLVCNCNCSS